MKDEELDYSVEERSDHRILILKGKLVLHNVEQFRDEFLKIVEQDRKNIHFNIKGLSFIDSSGMGLLITLNRKLQAGQRELVIVQPGEAIQKILHIAGLDKVFNVQS
ncbi:MAG: STAS domain-containing protein [bacterium]|nr:STAS domain-containing protein [bacterium]